LIESEELRDYDDLHKEMDEHCKTILDLPLVMEDEESLKDAL